MSGSKKMTLRVQSAEGTARVEVAEDEATARLYEVVFETLRLASFGFALHKDRARREEVHSSKSRTVRDYGLRHGDMLYLSPVNGAVIFDQASSSVEKNKVKELVEAGPSSAKLTGGPSQTSLPKEDDVDIILFKMSGKIERQRDEKLCRHNSNGCCVHCTPLEPWDEEYQKEQNIKHMSFHTYLRKQMATSKFISLDEPSYKIKPGCREHLPWPRGLCSQCAPGVVTLMRQQHRHVDNVLVSDRRLIDDFLKHWRSTASQSIGFLYGNYEMHPTVPLGIRARVEAIYVPEQESSREHVRLLPDPHVSDFDVLAAELGMRRVGWIFTDLVPLPEGKVQHIRGVDSHFLSAQECIMAGHFQNQYRNACRYAKDGYYGSKFVTVCVTGNSSQQIQLEGYQVSTQCAALVRDEILLPTKDAPELGYARDSTNEKYTPEVCYKERDAYGNEVSASSRIVPAAYLLVDLPVGSEGDTNGSNGLPAHRGLQTAAAARALLNGDALSAARDPHLLLWCANRVGLEAAKELAKAGAARDVSAAAAWLHTNAASLAPPHWVCPHCTFHNAHHLDHCDMCALPRGNAM